MKVQRFLLSLTFLQLFSRNSSSRKNVHLTWKNCFCIKNEKWNVNVWYYSEKKFSEGSKNYCRNFCLPKKHFFFATSNKVYVSNFRIFFQPCFWLKLYDHLYMFSLILVIFQLLWKFTHFGLSRNFCIS